MLFRKITFLIVRSTLSPPFFFSLYDFNLLSVGDKHVASVLMQLALEFGLHQT